MSSDNGDELVPIRRSVLEQTLRELERLREIEAAAKRFDESGSTVNQMSPKQWKAYTELKALFHGGILFHA